MLDIARRLRDNTKTEEKEVNKIFDKSLGLFTHHEKHKKLSHIEEQEMPDETLYNSPVLVKDKKV